MVTCNGDLAAFLLFYKKPLIYHLFTFFLGLKFYAMGVSTGPRLSGMQKQVLSLYRAFLRAVRSKSSEDRKRIESLVSAEFRRNSRLVDRKNFLYIEYLLRRGRKQLDQLKNRQTVGLTSLHISLSQADKPKR